MPTQIVRKQFYISKRQDIFRKGWQSHAASVKQRLSGKFLIVRFLDNRSNLSALKMLPGIYW